MESSTRKTYIFGLFLIISLICLAVGEKCPEAMEGMPYYLSRITAINVNMRDIVWAVTYKNGTALQISHCYHENDFCYDFTEEFTPSRHQDGDFYTNTLHITRINPEHNGMAIEILDMSRPSGNTNLVYSCTLVVSGSQQDGRTEGQLRLSETKFGSPILKKAFSSSIPHGARIVGGSKGISLISHLTTERTPRSTTPQTRLPMTPEDGVLDWRFIVIVLLLSASFTFVSILIAWVCFYKGKRTKSREYSPVHGGKH